MNSLKSSFLIFMNLVATSQLNGINEGPIMPNSFNDMSQEERALVRDLKLLNYPSLKWMRETDIDHDESYDVVIVGGGMAGLTAGAALYREAIYHIRIFDENEPGFEGPWINYARMHTLRSQKDLTGPALDIPHLTFHAWFEAQWGQTAWKELGKIPTSLWMDYLNWYKKAMQLPVENNWTLKSLKPLSENQFELDFVQGHHHRLVKAKKVVLATGRGGFGGANIPDFVIDLPKNLYAHTCDKIDFDALGGKKIAVIGVGSSGFDAAATALEAGVEKVDLISRRSALPNVNKFASLYYKSLSHGFYDLSDQMRWDFMNTAFEAGIPPPKDALVRLKDFQNFHFRFNTSIIKMTPIESQVQVKTNQGTFVYDFIILGTGFKIDGTLRPELAPIIDDIALWEDKMPSKIVSLHPHLGCYPYLGPKFEFLSKKEGTASYLKNVYCFNYGATLSHALISSDIPAISIGAKKLAEGIAADFFIQDSLYFLQKLIEFDEKDFDQNEIFKRTFDH